MKIIINYINLFIFFIGLNLINKINCEQDDNFSLFNKYCLFGSSILTSVFLYEYFKDSKLIENIKFKINSFLKKKLIIKKTKTVYINKNNLDYRNFYNLNKSSKENIINSDSLFVFEKKRDELLKSLNEDNFSDVVIVYGPSFSGKTSIIKNAVNNYLSNFNLEKNKNNVKKINYFEITYDFIKILFNFSDFLNKKYLFLGNNFENDFDKIEIYNSLNNNKLFNLTKENYLMDYVNYFFEIDENERIFKINSNSIFYININSFCNDFYYDFDKNKKLIDVYLALLASFLTNMKFFTNVKVVFEVENPYDLLCIKTYVENFSNKYLELNNQFNLNIISLEELTKESIYEIYDKIIFRNNNNNNFNKNGLLKLMVSFSQDFKLEDCLNFCNLLLNKLEKEQKELNKSTLNEFLIFYKNQKNIVESCVNKINENNFIKNPQINNEGDFFQKFKQIENINTKFSDVAGNENAKKEIMRFIDYLNNPEKYEKFGISVEKGILLMGPSGTGKTLLAKALAGEAGIPFFDVNGSDFVKMYVGTGSINIKNLFKEARKSSPCIIFIDEADALLRKRAFGDGNNEYDKTLNQFLVELDGFKENNFPILVICATNAPIETLDEAALIPGRIGKHIKCYLPLLKDRIEIAKIHGRNKFFDESVTPEIIAKKTPGFSGAEIAELLNIAAMNAFEKNKDKIYLEDLHESFEKMVCGNKMFDVVISEKSLRETAIHELGHTFCILFNKDSSMKFDSVSILPRDGGSLGVTYAIQEFEDFGSSKNKEELMADIVFAYGGMLAESIFLKTTTNGVFSDLKNIKNIANNMVVRYGMKGIELVGRELNDKDVQVAVKEILDECYKKAEKIILDNKHLMNILVEELLKKKVLYSDDIEKICKLKI